MQPAEAHLTAVIMPHVAWLWYEGALLERWLRVVMSLDRPGTGERMQLSRAIHVAASQLRVILLVQHVHSPLFLC